MLKVIVWGVHRLERRTLRCASVALRKSHPVLIHKKSELGVTITMHAFGGFIMCLIMLLLLRVVTSESMNPRPCFQALKHHLLSVLLLVTLLPFLLQIYKTLFYHPYYPYFIISSPN